MVNIIKRAISGDPADKLINALEWNGWVPQRSIKKVNNFNRKAQEWAKANNVKLLKIKSNKLGIVICVLKEHKLYVPDDVRGKLLSKQARLLKQLEDKHGKIQLK
jgi:hypothetical protein